MVNLNMAQIHVKRVKSAFYFGIHGLHGEIVQEI